MEHIPKTQLCLFVRYGNQRIWYPKVRYTSVKSKSEIIHCLNQYFSDSYDPGTDCVDLAPRQCSYVYVHYDCADRAWYLDGVQVPMPRNRKDLLAHFEIQSGPQTLHFEGVSPAGSPRGVSPDIVEEPGPPRYSFPGPSWYEEVAASAPTMRRPSAQTPETTNTHPPGTPGPLGTKYLTTVDKFWGAWSKTHCKKEETAQNGESVSHSCTAGPGPRSTGPHHQSVT